MGGSLSNSAPGDYFVVCGLNYDEHPVPFASAGGSKSTPEQAKKKEKERVVAGTAYKGEQLHRYPQEDQRERPLPGHLWVFLFPTGVRLEEHTLPPRFFVNALTYSDGTRSYVISIKVARLFSSCSLVSHLFSPTVLREDTVADGVAGQKAAGNSHDATERPLWLL